MMKDLFKQAGWPVGSAQVNSPEQKTDKVQSTSPVTNTEQPARQSPERRKKNTNQVSLITSKTAHQRQIREIDLTRIQLNADLPVSGRAAEIIAAIQQHQVVVLAGETGSGKTTQLPKLAMLAGRGLLGRIALTQPRRLAARSVADRLAEELQTPLGEMVGVKVRFHQNMQPSAAIKVLTDGMLLAEIQQDRLLREYDTIIVDEAHERSLNIDFLLGYLKQLKTQRPDLKIIITSATIDLARFSAFFDNAPTISVSGRTYPVEVVYQPRYELIVDDVEEREVDMSLAIERAVHWITERDPRGDILIFLAGEADIREAADALRQAGLAHTEVLPLFARQSFADQQKIFHPTGAMRRLVLATNVAETSLTVPGIRHVIDTGLARIKRYSPRMKVQRLPIEAISQASANQRKGRCGRVAAGICVRLYSEEDFLSRPAFTEPEIQRSNLASVILQMQNLSLGSLAEFPLLDPPSSKLINDGHRLLEELQALDERGRLTKLGQELVRLPTDPRVGRMLAAAQAEDVLAEMTVLAGVLTLQDPRETPVDKQQAAREKHRLFEDKRSDFLTLLNLWHEYQHQKKHLSSNKLKQWCEKHYLSHRRMREWQELVGQLHQSTSELKWLQKPLQARVVPEDGDQEQLPDSVNLPLHRALLAGLLGQVAIYDERHKYYQGARGVQLTIHPSSVLSKVKPKWIMAFEWLETSRTFARLVSSVDVLVLESLAKHLLKRQLSEPHWSKKQGRVVAKETVSLYGLIIAAGRLADFGKQDPEAARELFIQDGLVTGEVQATWPFLKHNMSLIEQALSVEDKIRRTDILVDDAALADFYRARLPAKFCRTQQLEQWLAQDPDRMSLLKMTKEDVFRKDAAVEQDFPSQLTLPNRLKLPLSYRFEPGEQDDGMTLEVSLAQLSLLRQDQLARLVPGLLPQKIELMLRHLAKPLRVRLQPIAETAQQLCQFVQQNTHVSFDQIMAQEVTKRVGQIVTPEDWRDLVLPDHLAVNIKVKQGKKLLGQGRDLLALQKAFADASREALLTQTQHKVNNTDESDAILYRWQWDHIPLQQKLAQGGQAYLAVIPVEDGVRLVPLPSKEEAEQTHAQGVRQLLVLALESLIKGMRKELQKQSGLCLAWARWQRSCPDLIEQIIRQSMQMLTPTASDVRDKATFEQLLQQVTPQITGQIRNLAQQTQQIVQQAQQLLADTDRLQTATRADSIDAIRHFIEQLLTSDFVLRMPATGWRDYPRYLKAAAYRLEKLTENLPLDERRQDEFEAIERLLKQRQGLKQTKPAVYAQAEQMAIELWVAIFAQPHAMKGAASMKKLETLLAI